MFKQLVSLIVFSTVVTLSAGLANANEVEVKTGNMRVSVENGKVQVNSNRAKLPSWIDRLSNLRLSNSRSSRSSVEPNVGSNMKCDRVSSGHSTTSKNRSGTAVSQSSSSSTTMTCH